MSDEVGATLTTAVRRGELAEVKKLIDTYGLCHSPSWLDGYSLLFEAILHKQTDIAKFLLANGCPVNDKGDAPETTPLHEAVKNGELKIVEILLSREANISIIDKYGKTPLYHAIERFSSSTRSKTEMKIITKVLKNRGADAHLGNVAVTIRDVAVKPCCIDSFINDLTKTCSIANNILTHGGYISCVRTLPGREGNKSLHFSASDSGREELVILILRKGNANADNRYEKQHSKSSSDHGTKADTEDSIGNRLYLGTATCEKTILKALLDNGAIVDTDGGTGKTVLQVAVEAGCSKVVEHVLRACPDVNYKTNRNSLKTAVTRLAGEQYRERSGSCDSYETYTEIEYKRIIKNLLRYGFTVDSKDAHDREFLVGAVATGFLRIVEKLVKYGVDVNMLHIAADNKQLEMVKLLISHGADVNSKDNAGKTPIFYAIRNIDVNITKVLLANGARVKGNADLFNTAIVMGNKDIVDIILEHEPDIDINAADDDGITALHCTALDKRDFIRFMFDSDRGTDIKVKENIAKLLLSSGANVDARSKSGMTALVIAAKKRRANLLEDLLKFRANVNSLDEHGSSALHIAANNNDLDIVNILVKFGANVNSRNHDGKTALHIACEQANLPIVTVLLNNAADINIGCYQNGDTPVIGAKIGLNRMSRNDRTMYPCSYDTRTKNNISAYHDIIDMLKQRLLKMIALSEHLSGPNLQWFCENTAELQLKDPLRECKHESKKMKNERIGNSSVRFYDILAKGVNQVAMYAGNGSIVQALESKNYDVKFPIYSKMIDVHFKRGQERLILLNSSSKNLNFWWQYEMPDVVIWEIFSYLRNEDLKNFIAACCSKEIGKDV